MNMIQNAKTQVLSLTWAAYEAAVAEGLLPEGVTVKPAVEIPKDTANGDYAANHAMTGARAMRMAPRKIAEILVANMELEEIIRHALKRLM